MDTSLLTAFKAAIFAETDPSFVALRNANETGQMAAWYNVASTFVVWRPTTPVRDIANQINWKNLTLSDAADSSATFTNRVLQCQSFQMTVQSLLMAAAQTGVLDTGRPNIRNGLSDSLSAVPSGAGGSTQSAGWANVKTAISRACTRAERIWATGTGTSATPGDMGAFEGIVTNDDIVNALRA